MDDEHLNPLIVADLVIDQRKFMLTLDGEQIAITKKELKILYLLASNPDTVHSRQTIFDYAWGEDILVGRRTIDVHIRRLRAKIGEHYIKTIKGVGYQFNE